jgi:hypothetical protein
LASSQGFTAKVRKTTDIANFLADLFSLSLVMIQTRWLEQGEISTVQLNHESVFALSILINEGVAPSRFPSPTTPWMEQ